MHDAFLDFEWSVAPRYDWQDWLDADGAPQTVPDEDLARLGSASIAELASAESEREQKSVGPVLAPILKDAGEVRRYRPMQRQHAALFREFAALDYKDRAAILAFAAKYGSLGLPRQHQTLVVRDRFGSRHHHSATGESHLGWALEICRMREGLKLAEHHATFERKRELKGLVDRHLQNVRGRLSFDRNGEPRLAIEPVTLVATMWLQLALALTGGKRFATCKFCRRIFEISTAETGFRSHREFCTDSCKTQDYRRRKRTAIQLAARGVSIRSISDRVTTNKATVKRWVTTLPARAKEKK
jgi:hypothetical protein